MKKIVYYVAISVDGFISQFDGSHDGFLSEGLHIHDYLESLKRFDTVLMGRKTYEVGLKMNVTDPYPNMAGYVFSTSMKESPSPNVQLVSSNTVETVTQIKAQEGKDIYVCGGGKFASFLFMNNLIDELIVKINPFVMGTGIPLFAESISQTALSLIKSEQYNNGVTFMHYEIVSPSTIEK